MVLDGVDMGLIHFFSIGDNQTLIDRISGCGT